MLVIVLALGELTHVSSLHHQAKKLKFLYGRGGRQYGCNNCSTQEDRKHSRQSG